MNNSDLSLKKIHHSCIICSDFERSKAFYIEVLGLDLIQETYRSDRDSYKLELGLNGHYILELISFPNPPARLSRPEACGLRHFAFEVESVEQAVAVLVTHDISCEEIRIDDVTHKKYTFFSDPDGLPIELYES